MRPEWADLRPYQSEALEAVAARKVPRGIVAITTGGGKAHIAGHLTEALGTERVLYVVHRDTLVEHLEKHVKRIVRGFVGVEQATRRAGPMASTVIASVQTLAAGSGKRLQALLERGFDALVTDEAHHSAAETYCRIQAAMGLLRPGTDELDQKTRKRLEQKWMKTEAPAVAHIGLTATPGRGDGIGLHLVFDDIIFRKDLKALVREGWLVPPVAYTVQTGTSLDGVRTLGKAGDYIEADLERVINVEARHDCILDGWRKAASGKRTLAFCATTKHADALAAHFSANGTEARPVHGGRSKSEQLTDMAWFQETPGAVITSCQLIGEGVDLPHVEAVLMARPTRSGTVYAQAIGRGVRLAPGARDYAESMRLGKAHCIVIDVTDSAASTGRKAMRIGDLAGAPWPEQIADGAELFVAVEEQEAKQKEEIRIGNRKASLKAIRLLDSAGLPKHFQLRWIQAGDSYLLPLPDAGMVRLATDTLDRWAPERQTGAEWKPMDVPASAEQLEVVKAVETWYRTSYPEGLVLVERDARWRKEEPSPAQIATAKRYGVAVEPGDTRGSVSDRIDAVKLARGETIVRGERPPEPPGGLAPCKKCGARMRMCNGRRGAFAGCSRYPDCNGTADINAVPAAALVLTEGGF